MDEDDMVVQEPAIPAIVFPPPNYSVIGTVHAPPSLSKQQVDEMVVDEPDSKVETVTVTEPEVMEVVTTPAAVPAITEIFVGIPDDDTHIVYEPDVVVPVVEIRAANSPEQDIKVIEELVAAMDVNDDADEDDEIPLARRQPSPVQTTYISATTQPTGVQSANTPNVTPVPSPASTVTISKAHEKDIQVEGAKHHETIFPSMPRPFYSITPSSPRYSTRDSKQTIETVVREEIGRAFTPPIHEAYRTSNNSLTSSTSAVAIPKRVDSIMDDGFVYVDGNYLHVNNQGIVSSFPEKDLPPTPSVVAELRESSAAASAKAASQNIRVSTSATRSPFAEFMTNSRGSVSGDEPRGILRGGPITPLSPSRKVVSIRDPSIAPEVEMPKSGWFGTRNPFKRSESPSSPGVESPRSPMSPTFSGRSESSFKTLFRPKTVSRQSNAPLSPSYGLNTQKYQEPAPSQMRQVSTVTQYNSVKNSELRAGGSSESLDLTRIRSHNTPARMNQQSNAALSFVSSRGETPALGTINSESINRSSTPLVKPEMTARSGTVMSLSASEYHVQFATQPRGSSESVHIGWDDKKMRSHVGTADCRAISRRNPESLLADLEAMFEQRGFEVASRNREDLGEFRFKVTRPGYLVRSDGVPAGYDDYDEDGVSGVAVSITELSKFMEVPRELVSDQPQSGFVPLPPVVSRSISRNEKLKQTTKIGRMLSGLPASLSKKVQYVKEYGIRYNNGFAPVKGPLTSINQKSSTTVTKSSKVQFVDEIVFYVELQKVANLPGVCVVAFKRVRGNIWSFKKLYNSLVGNLPLI
ncbi:UNVERIFIED_CONTAM: hypothetical protein HDU68_005393 [Siphonaria sp. JEL0065]|nr:hypothetical protein HDU68_005393 [Siphonaria sp. JEL0065]